MVMELESKKIRIYRPVRKPLGDKSSGETRKLPAAELTRMSSFPKCLTVDSTTLFASSCLRTSPSNPTAWVFGLLFSWIELTYYNKSINQSI